MHFSASVTICVFLNEDNEEKWAQATFPPDYETEAKRFRINPMHEFRQLDCISELFVAFNFVSKILKKGRKPTMSSTSTFLNATNEAIN